VLERFVFHVNGKWRGVNLLSVYWVP
jgi:hypothetical protein